MPTAPRLSANLRGALWLFAAAIVFSVMNGLIKTLGAELHAFQIAFFRSVFGLIAIAPFALRGGLAALAMGRPMLHVWRCGLGLVAMLLNFYALTTLPLATAVGLVFAKPLFMIVLAVLFLGEQVGWRRWLATVAGFFGVLLMVRPSAHGGLDPAAGAAVAAALAMAAVWVVVKQMTATERPATILFYFSGSAALGALPFALAVWRPVGLATLMLVMVMGTLGSIAQYMAVRAYRIGEATVVTPIDYVQLFFSALIGYFAFAELPDRWTVAGAALIVAANLYILHREARRGRGLTR